MRKTSVKWGAWLLAKGKPRAWKDESEERKDVIETPLGEVNGGGGGALTPTLSLKTVEPWASRFGYTVVFSQQISAFSPQSSPGLCFKTVGGIVNSQNLCQRNGKNKE